MNATLRNSVILLFLLYTLLCSYSVFVYAQETDNEESPEVNTAVPASTTPEVSPLEERASFKERLEERREAIADGVAPNTDALRERFKVRREELTPRVKERISNLFGNTKERVRATSGRF